MEPQAITSAASRASCALAIRTFAIARPPVAVAQPPSVAGRTLARKTGPA